jgi:hypothetical protein
VCMYYICMYVFKKNCCVLNVLYEIAEDDLSNHVAI